MNGPKNRSISSLYIPAVAMVAAAAVLGLVLFVLAYRAIQREKELMTDILLEKGSAIIRSLEAGTRTGMMGMRWGRSQFQDLLKETAGEPDIHYLIIADTDGNVLIHGDPEQVGTRISRPYELDMLLQRQGESWHILGMDGGRKVFEVAREFRPIRPRPPGRPLEPWRRRMMEMQRQLMPPMMQDPETMQRQLIFVGLKMDAFEAARIQVKRGTLLTGIVLLLVGSAAIFTILIIQNNQTIHRALRQVQTYADSVVANLPAGLISMDREGRIVSINRAGQEILGREEESIKGLPLEQVIPGNACDLHGLMARGTPVLDREIECAAEGDSSIPISLSATRMTDDEGQLTGAVVIFRDLRELRRLQEEVRRSERLASLGSLAAGIAHEIRNPLSSIKGLARYLGDQFKEGSEERGYASVMVDEVDRLNRAISELLEFARPAELSIRGHEMRELLEHSLSLVSSDAERKNISIQFKVPPGIPRALVDGDRFTQALLNIYQNSLAAMEGGGSLTVAAYSRPLEGMVEVRVEDTGSGIPQENIRRIFDPYFSTKKGGTGLGLAIVHKIVESHGGEIRVDSNPGQGTRFTILFPAADEAEPQEADHA